ncbi:hypothetical protein [Tenacibaculum maritimum]|uniref:hypothetical protein n=1 Tax=Tenacibaculum maritimum TaxID=107401 RepID=UPI003890CCE5
MGKIYNRINMSEKWSKAFGFLLIVLAFSFTTESAFSQNAALVVNASTTDGNDTVNDTVDYEVSIRNTGNVILTSVNLTNTLGVALTLSGGDIANPGVLDPDEIWKYTGVYINPSGAAVNNTFSLTTAEITTPITYAHIEAVHEDDYSSVTIVACSVIIANDDNFSGTTVNGLVGGVAGNALTNDTLNGVAVVAGDLNITTTANGENITVGADGSVNVPANTPAGNYQITYQICEKLNPTNCDTATVDITVGASTIVANDDNFSGTTVNGLVGGVAGNALTNDTLNGVAVVAGDLNITTTANGENITVGADGSVNVPANTPAGNYQITYQICEKLNPTNCDTATVDITVGASTIVANDDNFSGTTVNGLVGGVAGNALTNDTLNGVAVVAGDLNITTTANGENITVGADGSVNVPANTPAGNYQITYQICEKLNPTNCDTATVDITVGASTIVANDDNFNGTTVNGLVGGVAGNALTNDTLNGVAVVAGDLNITTTANGENITVGADGSVNVPANTPAGNYQITYQICEKLNPTNCDTATVDITVGASTIVANDDNFSGTTVNGLVGGVAGNALTNDTLNGVAVVAGDLNITTTANGENITVGADGSVNVPANTPAGNYQITYQICEKLNPTNCDTATVDITVGASTIVANDDNFNGTTVNGLVGGVAGNALTNDTLNGVAVVAGDLNITTTANGENITVGADGSVNVPANTPAGNYQITYQICEKLNPTNCDTATVDITVGASTIVANDDNFNGTTVNGLVGGVAGNALTNDTLNGVAVVAGDLNITTTANGENITVGADGSVNVPANTPAGNYQITYQICEKLNPTNCDTATVDITVGASTIVANDDNFSGTTVNGLVGGVAGNALTNDTLNGVAVVAGDLNITTTANGENITVGADGSVNVPANTPAGNYQITYQICEKLNPTNCDTATVDITVGASTIVANDDNFSGTTVNGLVGGVAGNALTNDTLNGVAVVAGDLNITTTANGENITVGADGSVNVPANTPAGNYQITYQICEKLNPTNCDTATVDITVGASTIVANDDNFSGTTVNGLVGGVAGNALTNDTLNGVAVVAGDLNITTTANGENITVGADGSVNVPANTPAGNYQITYQICEKLNPTNCDTATVDITVGASTIVANDDNFSGTTVNGLVGGVAGNALTNDTLNGVAVVAGDLNITTTANGENITVGADGSVNVPANTPAGNYQITYQICEKLNPTNCDTATVDITVGASTIVANDDNFSGTTVNGLVGGVAGNALTNDTLNGVAVVAGDLNITTTANGENITVGADGSVNVPANTPAGNYQITYQICEKLNPTNCDTATVDITVGASTIVANDDNFSGTTVNGLVGGVAGNALTNDTLNGVAVVAGDLNITTTANGENITVGADGSVNVPANTPAGNYQITYQICEKLNPTNCDTATVDITVGASTIVANDDNFSGTTVNGLVGGVAGNALTNDTLNGVAVVAGDLNITTTANGENITVGADGSVNVPANTPAGNYQITYQICEKLNPTNCDTATVDITVGASTIVANDDNFSGTTVNGLVGGVAGNALTNDTLNGVAVVARRFKHHYHGKWREHHSRS